MFINLIFPLLLKRKECGKVNLRQLLEDRCLLDRRHFEEAFILFAALEVCEKYKIKLKSMPSLRNMIVENITEEFHNAFSDGVVNY